MAENAMSRAKADLKIMEPVAEEAMKVLSKPLWQQFVYICKGKTIDECRDACRRFEDFLDKAEKHQAGSGQNA